MGFSRNYEYERLKELPQPELVRHLYFPGASEAGGADGVLIRVMPRSYPTWIGTFAFGVLTPHGITSALETPDPDNLCVVAKGRGYVVDTREPENHQEVLLHPIVDVHIALKRRLIVFVSFTELMAYDSKGMCWRTRRLSWDNLKITEVTDDTISGEFWDLQTERTSFFCVDLGNGEHQGGAQLPL